MENKEGILWRERWLEMIMSDKKKLVNFIGIW